jgi:3-oxoisoapionate kinase
MNQLLLTFYGDDFTGSTDALEQLTLAGIRTALFIEPPTKAQLNQFPNLQAIGVAGMTRALPPAAMKRELSSALEKLKKLGARHVHYKVCSTFDSAPEIGSIGCVAELAPKIFRAPFIPLLVAAPALGRFTIFGTHFARYGIGSAGVVHRLDRHPSISRHPVTPMTEADLRLHLARQTKKKIALFDVLKFSLPDKELVAELRRLLRERPAVILFDALDAKHLARTGKLIDEFASTKRPLFSIGSSGVETALAALWGRKNIVLPRAGSVKQILVGSGSCSPVTLGQINWAMKNGFAGVPLNTSLLASPKTRDPVIQNAATTATKLLSAGRSVILYTGKTGKDKSIVKKSKGLGSHILGAVFGRILREVLAHNPVQRVCIAGGDTSSFAARALGVESLEMIAPLTPGAPLCRVHAPGSPVDKREIVFKGGQVGAERYFETVKRGRV